MKAGKISLPKNFIVPENCKVGDFYFSILEPSITEIDYKVVMSSRKRLRQIFRRDDTWPAEGMTLDENTKDLIRHETEFKRKKAFAYSVYPAEKNDYIGCIYINPTKKSYDCEVYLWVSDNSFHMDNVLFRQTKKWLDEVWGFSHAAFPGREISWDEWQVDNEKFD